MKPTIEHTARLLSLQRNLLAQQNAEAGAATSERVRQRWWVRIEQTEKVINKLERQIMEQEQKDVWTIWEWGKQYGIRLHDSSVDLGNSNGIGTRHFSDRESLDWLNQAAKWCKQQRKEKGNG